MNVIDAARIRRTAITNELARVNGPKVMAGPFAGMVLLPDIAWGDGDLPPRLLGCYEEELHPAVAKAIARAPKAVVNIGAAEGYYAVGMARALPQSRVLAFEINERGQGICRRAADANQVGDRVVVGGKCDVDTLRQVLAQNERPLLIVDCEGDELTLLDPAQNPAILKCDMIIECHDFINARITPTLRERFFYSHEVELVTEGPRDPNRFAALRRWSSLDRWLAVNENRPCTMNWLVCWTR